MLMAHDDGRHMTDKTFFTQLTVILLNAMCMQSLILMCHVFFLIHTSYKKSLRLYSWQYENIYLHIFPISIMLSKAHDGVVPKVAHTWRQQQIHVIGLNRIDCADICTEKYVLAMDSSTNFQASPHAAYFLWYCDKVYHKQEVCFILYFLGQIVSWQYNPNLLD